MKLLLVLFLISLQICSSSAFWGWWNKWWHWKDDYHCRKRYCSHDFYWSYDECDCVCDSKWCPDGQYFDTKYCRCEGEYCIKEHCYDGYEWNDIQCKCVPCRKQWCRNGYEWDETTCSCEKKYCSRVKECRKGKYWDDELCRCVRY